MTKSCTGCGLELDLSQFRFRTDRGYHSSRCRSCEQAKQREWLRSNPDKQRQYNKRWRSKPGNDEVARTATRKWRAANLDHRREYERQYLAARPGYSAEKKRRQWERDADRMREVAHRWKANNPDKVRAQWQRANANGKNHRRRARIAGAAVIEKKIDRSYIYDRDGGRCHICGKKVAENNFHLDHLVPLSKGGDHAASNLRIAHPACNLRRGAGRLPAQLLLVP